MKRNGGFVRARRGVTLIEAVLYISVALGLIVGGLVFYQQATVSSRVNAQIRDLSSVLAEVRQFYGQDHTWLSATRLDRMNPFVPGTIGADERIEAILIAAGSVPEHMIDRSGTTPTLLTHWNTRLEVGIMRSTAGFATSGSRDNEVILWLILHDIPHSACNRLAGVDASMRGVFADRVLRVSAHHPNPTEGITIWEGVDIVGELHNGGRDSRTWGPSLANFVCNSDPAVAAAPSVDLRFAVGII